MLRVAFKRYPGQRAAIVQELLPVLSQVYGAKTVARSYPLHHSLHVGRARVAPAFAAVLHMMQARPSPPPLSPTYPC